MLNIAITGGIGAGKSRVTSYLRELGFTVVDADEMSRAITSPGGKAIPYIRAHFGPEFIREDGGLDRARMRDLVFNDPGQKAILEEGTTKVILKDIEAIRKENEEKGASALFYDIPLLYEKGLENDYDAVWVITADHAIRAERIMERDGISPEMIDLIMDSQVDDDMRVEKADHVIYNNGTIAELRRSVDDALACYKLTGVE